MDKEIKEIMEDYNIELEEAEEVQEFSDELGIDLDDVHEILEMVI